MKIALAVACLLCSLTACGQEQKRSALDDLIRSAEQGDPLEQYHLGLRYDFGDGVPRDPVEAVKWYRLAAEQGRADGQTSLAIAYLNGKGVPQDYVLAHMWFNIVASRKFEPVATMFAQERGKVAGKMTPQQIAEAQRLARGWKPKTWDELKDQ